jgi:hypothetical protein
MIAKHAVGRRNTLAGQQINQVEPTKRRHSCSAAAAANRHLENRIVVDDSLP